MGQYPSPTGIFDRGIPKLYKNFFNTSLYDVDFSVSNSGNWFHPIVFFTAARMSSEVLRTSPYNCDLPVQPTLL